MKNLKLALAIFVLFSTYLVKGQDVGNNTLIINSGFTPEIKDAKKLNHNPLILDTVYDVPQFNYSIVSSRIATPFQPRPIGPAKMSGEKLDKIYNGYVAVGMGNYATPMFELLYGLGRSRDQFGGLQIKHLSSAGKMADYIFPGFSDNLFGGYYSKMGGKNRFTARADYQRKMFHYYGVNTEDTALSSLGDLTDKANEHLFNKASASFDFGRYDLNASKINFNLGLDYYFLMDNYKSYENRAMFDGFVDWKVKLFSKLDDQKIGIASGFDFYNQQDSLEANNAWILNINPYFKFHYNKLEAVFGIKANVVDDSLTELFFFPDINLKLAVIDKVLSFGFAMSGGAIKQNFNNLSNANPFINSVLPMQVSVNRFRAAFSMYSAISKYINFQLGMDYQKWGNGAFFITDTAVALRNKFTLIYDDYDMILLKAGASFHKNEKLDMEIEANYYVYNTLTELYAWQKPDFDIKLQAIYRIGDKFRINADVVYSGPSKALVFVNGIKNAETIKSWVDGSLGVEYRFKKQLGFFANFNNIAAAHYQRWYNFPSQGFNFMAGVNYIF